MKRFYENTVVKFRKLFSPVNAIYNLNLNLGELDVLLSVYVKKKCLNKTMVTVQ